MSLLRRFDGYQQRHPWLAFPIAVLKKFHDDRAGNLAAQIAFYAFFSLFPLLLILVSVLGFLLGESSEFRDEALDSALAQFPILGEQIRADVASLRGSGVAVSIGAAVSLVAGLWVVQALQHGMDDVWNVPEFERRSFPATVGRSMGMLGVLGLGIVGSAILSSFGPKFFLAGVVIPMAVNFVIFLVAFRVLTSAQVSWRDAFPGAIFAAAGWASLVALGKFIVRTELTRISAIYGFFAVVIGLLSWLLTGAQLTLLAAEINVVRTRVLWPRNLPRIDPSTSAEQRVLSGLAMQELRHPEQSIDVAFGRSDEEDSELVPDSD